MAIPPHVARGEPIVQPGGRLAEEHDIVAREADLLVQLAKERVLGLLAVAHAALGKLPAAAAGAPAEKHLPRAAHQDDAHVRAKAFGVDHITHAEVESATAGGLRAASVPLR